MLWHLYCHTSMEIFVRTFPNISLIAFPTRAVTLLGLVNVFCFLGYMAWAWETRIDWSQPPSEWDWDTTPMSLRIMCYPLVPTTFLGILWPVVNSLVRLSLTTTWCCTCVVKALEP